ncbi:MAG: nickel-dependent lactate racemase [Bacteroidales bacterium]|nr:nickel-dependent lactate racemase [Bacteroidales bacterium]
MVSTLAYGSSGFSFPMDQNPEMLSYSEPECNISKESFQQSLSERIRNTSQQIKNVAIVVADKTRLCGYDTYLPWILETLQENNIPEKNITFYIAYGTHPRQSDEESRKAYGEVYNTCRFVHHDCADISVFQNFGRTSRGTEINVRKDILDAGLVISFGAISHHYFAGFGGGRKLFFPGLGEKQAVYHNHSLFLNAQNKILEPNCQPGVLENNPLAEDLKEIDTYAPSRISIHGILDSHGHVCQLLFGDNYNDFLNACKEHDVYYKARSDKQYDMVLASAGGYPKDINFIQAHKSVHNAAAFVKDGGSLVLLAECRDGIGTNSFLPVFDLGNWNTTFNHLLKNYQGNGGTALAMMAKTSRIKIYMLTSLDLATCDKIGVKKVLAEDINDLIAQHSGSIAVIENASMLVK